MNAEHSSELLDEQEAAEYVRCSTRQMYNFRAQELVEFCKPGLKILYQRGALDALIAKLRVIAQERMNRRKAVRVKV